MNLIYTHIAPYQYFWKDRGYTLRPGDMTPDVPQHEAIRLLKTGFFGTNEHGWKILYPDRKSVEGMLKGKRCFILGGGPSAKNIDFKKLKNEFVIAVNHSFDFYPDASAVLFVDSAYLPYIEKHITHYNGLIFASFRCGEKLPKLQNIYVFPQNSNRPGLTLNEGLYTGRLSGLCAINLALIMGAEEIYLLGYDMCYEGRNHHWYGEACENQRHYAEEHFLRKVKLFDAFAPYAYKIFNCSKISKIKTFTKVNYDEIFTGSVIKRKPIEAVTPHRVSSTPTYPVSPYEKLKQINGMLIGKDVFVIGSGPSLKSVDLSVLDGQETIVVNHTIEYYRGKYYLMGCPTVYQYTNKYLENYNGLVFASHHVNLGEERKKENYYVFAKNWHHVTTRLEDGLYSDFNSGMEAVNLALIMGAKTVYLLGIDFCANNGEYYFYGRPAWIVNEVRADSLLQSRIKYWDAFSDYKDRIINLSPISKISIFQKKRLQDVIQTKTMAEKAV